MDKLLTNTNGKLLGNEDGKVYTTPAITDRTYKQKYQEVLWLGSDMIPELPTQMPDQQGIDGYIDALAKIWTDIDDDNYSIINFGYNRVVLLAQYSGKLVKVEIVQEPSGLFGSRVHSSVYKANVKECISLNTNKRYKLINDTYETLQEPSYFIEEISSSNKLKFVEKVIYNEEYSSYKLSNKLNPNKVYLFKIITKDTSCIFTVSNSTPMYGESNILVNNMDNNLFRISLDSESFDDIHTLNLDTIDGITSYSDDEIEIYELPFTF